MLLGPGCGRKYDGRTRGFVPRLILNIFIKILCLFVQEFRVGGQTTSTTYSSPSGGAASLNGLRYMPTRL